MISNNEIEDTFVKGPKNIYTKVNFEFRFLLTIILIKLYELSRRVYHNKQSHFSNDKNSEKSVFVEHLRHFIFSFCCIVKNFLKTISFYQVSRCDTITFTKADAEQKGS